MVDDLARFAEWLAERELPPHLKSEMDYYMHEVERDYTLTLAEAVDDWVDRHATDPKAGWLNRQDLTFLRDGWVECGVAKPLDRHDDSLRVAGGTPKSQRKWFTHKGVAYEYSPNED